MFLTVLSLIIDSFFQQLVKLKKHPSPLFIRSHIQSDSLWERSIIMNPLKQQTVNPLCSEAPGCDYNIMYY